jgi:hypothetical protein|tara:strand:+ start:302 stop:460 length:159 start_codon:yes stop_codon:yes gene_type:complete
MGWYDKSETIKDIHSVVMSGNVNDEQCEKLLAIAYELELEIEMMTPEQRKGK